jgi:formate C-acetyltransferase/benzylsuccinate synthase
VLKSCSKIDHIGDGRAFLLNQRLSPTQLAGEKGYQLWRSYIKTWADLGLDHVQFNMVSDETLRAAQREPEKYQEVIVRVAGYSAHFVDIRTTSFRGPSRDCDWGRSRRGMETRTSRRRL